MVQWLGMQVLGMEVPGSNSGKFFFDIFAHLFYSTVTALLQYLDPVILHLLGFCFILQFVAVTLLLFKLSKGTATMISLSTHQFSSYFYTWFTL